MNLAMLRLFLWLIGALSACAVAVAVMPDQQSVTVIVSRGGAGGVDLVSAGLADYLELLNRRDGGINGERLVRDECDHALDEARAVACIERAQRRSAAIVLPSGALSKILIDRGRLGRVPMLMPDDGASVVADACLFPHAFALLAGPLSQAAAQLRFIADSEGGVARLRGKRIAYLYTEHPNRHEVLDLLELLSADRGFSLGRHVIGASADDQAAVWQAISRDDIDWVLLATTGPATTMALRTAADVGFPVDRIIGSGPAGAERDVAPAGAAAIGYLTAATSPSGGNFALIREIRHHVGGTGSMVGTEAESHDPGNADYVRGVAQGLLIGEATRLAQRRFGARPLDGEELRWGLERLQLDDERLSQLGALEMLPPIFTSCRDHGGSDAVKFQQWLGTRWNVVSDWISGHADVVERIGRAGSGDCAAKRGPGSQRP